MKGRRRSWEVESDRFKHPMMAIGCYTSVKAGDNGQLRTSFLRDNGCAHTGGDVGFELHDYLIGEELRKVGEGVEPSSGLNFSQTEDGEEQG